MSESAEIVILPGVPANLDPKVAVKLPRLSWSSLGIGPCMRCGTDHERYGPGGSPLCTDCRREVRGSAVAVRTDLGHNCIECGQWYMSGSVLYLTPYGWRCVPCYESGLSSARAARSQGVE